MRSTATREIPVPVHRVDGHRYRATAQVEVTAAAVREFARAVRDVHPAHSSAAAAAELGYPALIAPPTWSSIVLGRVQREILDIVGSGSGRARILHADQVIDIGRPLFAGDLLGCDIYFESFRQFADYDVMAIRSALIAADGTVVQTGSAALLARTGERESVLGEVARRITERGYARVDGPAREAPLPARTDRAPRPAVRFDELAPGAELPPGSLLLAHEDLARFAAATGEPARPDAGGTAPGMLQLGLASGYVSNWLGDPGAVTRIRAQFGSFTHYLRIPAAGAVAVTLRGRVDQLDPRTRRATLALDLRSGGRPLFGYAAAEIRFP
ncbi:FAS1-like dehydratase domain-containing protein [Nocardia harenae]|uniref:FAS1-like dehydratase domain-containing protein n=1 Tax=Nocardia harenae TaxID=358707 RepID=UPI0008358192|nr:MaoC family dehydratase N-terminal domain-containing protein [Nocardia harenae]